MKIADSLIGGNTVKIISKLQELLSQVRTLRLGGPENEAVLSNLFVDNTPASVPIRSFAKVRRARDEFESTVEQFDEMSGIAVQKIPDVGIPLPTIKLLAVLSPQLACVRERSLFPALAASCGN